MHPSWILNEALGRNEKVSRKSTTLFSRKLRLQNPTLRKVLINGPETGKVYYTVRSCMRRRSLWVEWEPGLALCALPSQLWFAPSRPKIGRSEKRGRERKVPTTLCYSCAAVCAVSCLFSPPVVIVRFVVVASEGKEDNRTGADLTVTYFLR